MNCLENGHQGQRNKENQMSLKVDIKVEEKWTQSKQRKTVNLSKKRDLKLKRNK